MHSLGKLIDPEDFEKYINSANELETVLHNYGNPLPVKQEPFWLGYSRSDGANCSLSFTQNTYMHPLLLPMVDKIMEVLTPIFPENSPPNPNRIHLIRTVGNIVPHRDEAGRMCCINIGLYNSSSATTRIGNDNTHSTFSTNYTDYILEDGYAYLVNTSRLHAVLGPNIPRYLITYGFGEKYDTVLSRFRLPPSSDSCK